VDGLRILQFLKSAQKKLLPDNENNLRNFLNKFHEGVKLPHNLNFETTHIRSLDEVRNELVLIEDELRQEKL
jgi:hypothetical protein